MSLRTGVLLLTFFLCHSLINAQIVNIEKQRLINDTVGWFGDVHADIAAQRTTKNLFSFSAGGLVQYQNRKTVLLFIGDFNVVKAEEEKFSDAQFLHMRYNRKLSKVIRHEIFVQAQNNSLTKIDQRILAGTGLRFKLTNFEDAKFYWGIAYMFEHERVIDQIELHNHHRMSSYFTFTLTPEPTVTFRSTTYIQPRMDLWEDYRLSSENLLSLKITDKLSLSIQFRATWDSAPPIEVPGLIYTFRNGLNYSF